MGGTFLFLGFLTILSEKIENHHSIIPSSFHAIVAFTVLILIGVQVFIGQQRMDQATFNPQYKRWHNDFGLILWDLLCFVIFTGLATFLPFGFIQFILLWIPGIVWLTVISQYYSTKNPSFRMEDDVDRSADDYDDKPLSTNFRASNSNLAALENGGVTSDSLITDGGNGSNKNDDEENEIIDETSQFLGRKDDNNTF
jgi:hypothetical protein